MKNSQIDILIANMFIATAFIINGLGGWLCLILSIAWTFSYISDRKLERLQDKLLSMELENYGKKIAESYKNVRRRK